MTLSTTTNRASYAGDGSTTAFAVPFLFLANGDIQAVLRDAAGAETTWVENTQYTLTGAGNAAGGTLTVKTTPTDYTPASGETLVIRRVVSETQETDYPDGGAFPASAHEQALDKLTMLVQQHSEELSRSMLIPVSDSSIGALPAKSALASKVLGFDANGDPIAATGIANAVSAFIATLIDDLTAAAARITLGIDGASGNIASGDLAADAVTTAKIADGAVTIAKTADEVFGAVENLIDNGSFRVAQRGASFTAATTPANNDDTYLLDRWLLLSDGNDIVDVDQHLTRASLPDGSYSGIELLVATTNKKFGICQIVASRNAHSIIGGTCSLSFTAESVGGTISHLRAAVLAWNGTEDAVTSDVVSAWNAEGTNPTLVANWTYENTPVDLSGLTTSFVTFKIENISIDTGSAKNVAVFIWSDDTANLVNEGLIITDVLLTPGPNAVALTERSYAEELERCEFHVWRVEPKSSVGAALVGKTHSVSQAHFTVPHRMFAVPTLSQSGLRLNDGGGNHAITSLSNNSTDTVISIVCNTGGAMTIYRTVGLIYENSGCYIMAEADL